MRENATYRAALYMRLSRDDDGAGESASIATQRRMLQDYAADNGYPVVAEYVDDGWSGTNFDRPGFRRLIADIEAKKIDLVITKDLSRLGRDYIMTGQYTELYFPGKGVRCIAVNDGYDSDSPYTDVAPFKNVINEMYARDTSRKIRSAFLTKMRDGAYIAAFAPYGYQKDISDNNHLVVDPCSGEIVKKIFQLAANGTPPSEIARTLNGQGIPPPAVYRCMTHDGLDARRCSKRQEWTAATIAKMLRNAVYLGNTVQGKTSKVSFKSRATIRRPDDEWVVVENTHEALVDQDTFELVRRHSAARHCKKKGTFRNLFSGIAKCADCGRCMSATGTRKKGSPANLTCGGYKLYGRGECSNHFIDYNALYELVQRSLKEQLCMSDEEREAILGTVWRAWQGRTQKKEHASALLSLRNRLRLIESIIEKLYEDHAAGRLCDTRMNDLLLKYGKESEALERRMRTVESRGEAEEEAERALREKLEGMLRRIIDGPELTPALLFQLIERIEIEQGVYEQSTLGRVRRQTVKICYRFQTEPSHKDYTIG